MDHIDRHVWMSPKVTMIQAALIAENLSEQFPEHRVVFTERSQKLVEELKDLDQEIEAALASVTDRILLVSHPAFGYFCRDYDFEQLSIEYEGKEPRPKHLEQVLGQAMAHHAEMALALPQHNNKGAQLIAEKLHVPVRMIDPYAYDYFATMHRLVQLITDPSHNP
jgi:zinc transport system substrate-binding protein